MAFDPDAYLRGEPQPADAAAPRPWGTVARELDETLSGIAAEIATFQAQPADPEHGPTSPRGARVVRQNYQFACFVVTQLQPLRRRLARHDAPDAVRQEVHMLLIRARWVKRDLFALL